MEKLRFFLTKRDFLGARIVCLNPTRNLSTQYSVFTHSIFTDLIEPVYTAVLLIQPKSYRSQPVGPTTTALRRVGAVAEHCVLVTNVSEPILPIRMAHDLTKWPGS